MKQEKSQIKFLNLTKKHLTTQRKEDTNDLLAKRLMN